MIRPTADNVVIRMLPEAALTAGGLHIPQQAHGRRAVDARRAEVLAVGPGHYRTRKQRLGETEFTVQSVFVPTQVKAGETVLVLARSGQDYALDINVPRHNKPAGFGAMGDERGEFFIVREDEVLGVLEE